MSGRIGIRTGEALVAGGPPFTAAEPEVAIGEMDGPLGTAFANLLGNQVVGHSRVLALLNTDVMVRPATLCVSKVTVTNERYTNILMGTVQYATAMGVLDAVRSSQRAMPESVAAEGKARRCAAELDRRRSAGRVHLGAGGCPARGPGQAIQFSLR